jgi:leucyl-tRNA synthetase
MRKDKESSKEVLEKALKLLSPICPHITEELWEKLSNKTLLSKSSWPEFKEIKEKQEKQDVNQIIINL